MTKTPARSTPGWYCFLPIALALVAGAGILSPFSSLPLVVKFLPMANAAIIEDTNKEDRLLRDQPNSGFHSDVVPTADDQLTDEDLIGVMVTDGGLMNNFDDITSTETLFNIKGKNKKQKMVPVHLHQELLKETPKEHGKGGSVVLGSHSHHDGSLLLSSNRVSSLLRGSRDFYGFAGKSNSDKSKSNKAGHEKGGETANSDDPKSSQAPSKEGTAPDKPKSIRAGHEKNDEIANSDDPKRSQAQSKKDSSPGAGSGSLRDVLPIIVGNNFKSSFSDLDLFKGVKLNLSDGEKALKAKLFSGNVVSEIAAGGYVEQRLIDSAEDYSSIMDIEGAFTASFGGFKLEASGKYVTSSVSSNNKVVLMYVCRRQAYVKRGTNHSRTARVEQLFSSGGGGKTAVIEEFGTYFIDQVIYGAQLNVKYTITSDETVDKELIEVEAKGIMKYGAFKGTLEGKFNKDETTGKSSYNMDIEISSAGVDVSAPSFPDLNETIQYIKDWNKEYDKLHKNIKDSDGNLKADVPGSLTVVAVSLSKTENYIDELDADSAAVVTDRMEKLSYVTADTIYKLGELDNEDSIIKEFTDSNPRWTEEIYNEWRTAKSVVKEELDKKIQECLKYRGSNVTALMTLPRPTRIETELDTQINGLIGKGFIPTPTIEKKYFPNMYYTGYVKDRDPFYKGMLRCLDDDTVRAGPSSLSKLANTSPDACENFSPTRPELLILVYDNPKERDQDGKYFRFDVDEFGETFRKVNIDEGSEGTLVDVELWRSGGNWFSGQVRVWRENTRSDVGPHPPFGRWELHPFEGDFKEGDRLRILEYKNCHLSMNKGRGCGCTRYNQCGSGVCSYGTCVSCPGGPGCPCNSGDKNCGKTGVVTHGPGGLGQDCESRQDCKSGNCFTFNDGTPPNVFHLGTVCVPSYCSRDPGTAVCRIEPCVKIDLPGQWIRRRLCREADPVLERRVG